MRSRVLDEGDRDLVARLVGTDPVAHCFIASRVVAGVLHAEGPGELWGFPAAAPSALLHVGANLVPLGVDAAAREAFVADLGRWRGCVAIVGLSGEALPLWHALGARWGEAYARVRLGRERQGLMALAGPSRVPSDPRVRPATPADFDAYLRAAVAMYTEELEEDPLRTNPHGYRGYVRGLVEQGRAFLVMEAGEVVFKADVGAQSAQVAQVQGVWVNPRFRGRGIAAPAMAAVSDRITSTGRVASLYVNDFNAPAVAAYARCGYEVVGQFTTVLY